VKLGGGAATVKEVWEKYEQLRSSLNGAPLGDDFDLQTVLAECDEHLPRVLDTVNKVCRLTENTDSLGLIFNTLLRGKFEGGEGLGTFLTPEQVVIPMVDMLLDVVGRDALRHIGSASPFFFGDICGGTGRFVWALARRLESLKIPRRRLEKAARLFDQSMMAVDLGRLNFLFERMQPTFERVGDSMIAPQVTKLNSRFLLLATNPPFGSNKYRWSPALAESLPAEVLTAIGMRGTGDSADPSELFFFRNLDLLAPGGALAIVLPDGVVQSEDFRKAVSIYEQVRNCNLHLAAIVSLPAVTFALGGTVARTSFLIVQKQDDSKDRPLYAAVAHHVGFVKRRKARANDPAGNELEKIASEFASGQPTLGRLIGCWREYQSLVPAALMHSPQPRATTNKQTLADLVEMTRDFRKSSADSEEECFHVSVLDVDATGLIDIVAARQNRPLSKGLQCQPGDILVSCMNPKIWRVAVIPQLAGVWSGSPEFAVLRPKTGQDPWKIAVALHHPGVILAVQALARGTSSSRQRVPKERVLSVAIPEIEITDTFPDYIAWREGFYRKRLLEAKGYEALHGGSDKFPWQD
jgi:type I restriction-modification system DNA methylase subunit